jgi:hypothetical protein
LHLYNRLMIKGKIYSSLKYVGVAAANVVLLTGMLALWTDPLELTFHELVRPVEFLKVLGVSSLALLVMFLLAFFLKRRSVKTGTKVVVASLLTMVISSGLYVTYSRRVLHNVMIQGRLRAQVAGKIRPSHGLANGTKADHLSFDEYGEVARTAGFPDIPPAASDIKYDFQYDGFLPDYSLDITYEVPKATKISSSEDSTSRYTRYQTVEVADDNKRVSYHEDIH